MTAPPSSLEELEDDWHGLIGALCFFDEVGWVGVREGTSGFSYGVSSKDGMLLYDGGFFGESTSLSRTAPVSCCFSGHFYFGIGVLPSFWARNFPYPPILR